MHFLNSKNKDKQDPSEESKKRQSVAVLSNRSKNQFAFLFQAHNPSISPNSNNISYKFALNPLRCKSNVKMKFKPDIEELNRLIALKQTLLINLKKIFSKKLLISEYTTEIESLLFEQRVSPIDYLKLIKNSFTKHKKNETDKLYILGYLFLLKNFMALITKEKGEKEDSILESLKQISEYVNCGYVKKDRMLCKYGDRGRALYIILSGQIDILIKQSDSFEITLQQYFIYLGTLLKYQEFTLLNFVLKENYYNCPVEIINEYKTINNTNNEVPLYNQTTNSANNLITIINNKIVTTYTYQNYSWVPELAYKKLNKKETFTFKVKELIKIADKNFSIDLPNSEIKKMIQNATSDEYISRLKTYEENITINCNEVKDKKWDSVKLKNMRLFYYVKITTRTQGDLAGEIALTDPMSLRTATMIIREDTYLGIIDKEHYKKSIKTINEKQIKSNAVFIQSFNLFSEIQEFQMSKKYFNNFIFNKLPKHSILAEQNKYNEYVYFLKAGQIEVNFLGSIYELINIKDNLLNKIDIFKGRKTKNDKKISSTFEYEKIFVENIQFKNEFYKKNNIQIALISSPDILGLADFRDDSDNSFFTLVCKSNYCEELNVPLYQFKKLFNSDLIERERGIEFKLERLNKMVSRINIITNNLVQSFFDYKSRYKKNEIDYQIKKTFQDKIELKKENTKMKIVHNLKNNNFLNCNNNANAVSGNEMNTLVNADNGNMGTNTNLKDNINVKVNCHLASSHNSSNNIVHNQYIKSHLSLENLSDSIGINNTNNLNKEIKHINSKKKSKFINTDTNNNTDKEKSKNLMFNNIVLNKIDFQNKNEIENIESINILSENSNIVIKHSNNLSNSNDLENTPVRNSKVSPNKFNKIKKNINLKINSVDSNEVTNGNQQNVIKSIRSKLDYEESKNTNIYNIPTNNNKSNRIALIKQPEKTSSSKLKKLIVNINTNSNGNENIPKLNKIYKDVNQNNYLNYMKNESSASKRIKPRTKLSNMAYYSNNNLNMITKSTSVDNNTNTITNNLVNNYTEYDIIENNLNNINKTDGKKCKNVIPFSISELSKDQKYTTLCHYKNYKTRNNKNIKLQCRKSSALNKSHNNVQTNLNTICIEHNNKYSNDGNCQIHFKTFYLKNQNENKTMSSNTNNEINNLKMASTKLKSSNHGKLSPLKTSPNLLSFDNEEKLDQIRELFNVTPKRKKFNGVVIEDYQNYKKEKYLLNRNFYLNKQMKNAKLKYPNKSIFRNDNIYIYHLTKLPTKRSVRNTTSIQTVETKEEKVNPEKIKKINLLLYNMLQTQSFPIEQFENVELIQNNNKKSTLEKKNGFLLLQILIDEEEEWNDFKFPKYLFRYIYSHAKDIFKFLQIVEKKNSLPIEFVIKSYDPENKCNKDKRLWNLTPSKVYSDYQKELIEVKRFEKSKSDKMKEERLANIIVNINSPIPNLFQDQLTVLFKGNLCRLIMGNNKTKEYYQKKENNYYVTNNYIYEEYLYKSRKKHFSMLRKKAQNSENNQSKDNEDIKDCINFYTKLNDLNKNMGKSRIRPQSALNNFNQNSNLLNKFNRFNNANQVNCVVPYANNRMINDLQNYIKLRPKCGMHKQKDFINYNINHYDRYNYHPGDSNCKKISTLKAINDYYKEYGEKILNKKYTNRFNSETIFNKNKNRTIDINKTNHIVNQEYNQNFTFNNNNENKINKLRTKRRHNAERSITFRNPRMYLSKSDFVY